MKKKKTYGILLDIEEVEILKELQEIEKSSFSFLVRKCIRIGKDSLIKEYERKNLIPKGSFNIKNNLININGIKNNKGHINIQQEVKDLDLDKF